MAGNSLDELTCRANGVLRKLEGAAAVDGPYVEMKAGIVWRGSVKGGHESVALTNFAARITADVVLDDGLAQSRSFELETQFAGRTQIVRVPA